MDMVDLSQIGALVRDRRGSKSVRETANEIGVSSATLSRIENGKQPDLGTFQKLCIWLEVSPSAFLQTGPTDEKSSDSQDPVVATAHLRANRHISPALARALGEMILRAQDMYPDDSNLQDNA